MKKRTLIGPFHQILTLANLTHTGPIKDEELEIVENGAVLVIHNMRVLLFLLTEQQEQPDV